MHSGETVIANPSYGSVQSSYTEILQLTVP